MDASTTKMAAQLRRLHQLTQMEARLAQTRLAQARTAAARRELARIIADSAERSRLIAETLRALGGAPDVLVPGLGRLAAAAKAGVEQAQTPAEVLLGDLMLEHQLLDRARYLIALARAEETRNAATATKVCALAERLIAAHTATRDWLLTVLAEEALGSPAAIRPTLPQRVVGDSVRLAGLPVRWAAARMNQTMAALSRMRRETTTSAGRLWEVAGDAIASGRDASLATVETAARRGGADGTASAVHEARRGLGALTADELPIKDYDNLTASEAAAAVKRLTDPADIRAVILYEERHKARSSVVSAAQTRLVTVAKQVTSMA